MAQEGNLEIPITKLQWGLRGAQALFAFLAMCTIAAVISFDNKHTSSSILDNYYLFVTVVSMFVAAAIVGIPYIYLQYGKLKAAARALRQLRVEFVLSGMWAFLIFVGTLGVTIEIALRSCAAEDYTEQFLNFTANNRTGGDHSFERGITRTCTTGRAASGFGYLAIVAWLGSMLLLAKEWYDNRRSPLPKHDYPHEVTMHANSTKTSLESGFPPTSEYKDQVQMEGVQNPPSGGNQEFYSQPVYQQQYPSAPSPIPAPTSQPPPQQYNNPLQFSPAQSPPPPPPQQYNNPLQFSPAQPPQPGSGGITFPEPKHYQ